MQFIELVLMGLTFVSLLVRYVFGYQPIFFAEIFSLALAVAYFPFGFYTIGKPSENYSNTTSVILGLIYALGITTILISEANIDSYRYPLIGDFFILAALIIYLLYKMRSAAYPKTYVNAQFIRIGFIILCSFIVLVK